MSQHVICHDIKVCIIRGYLYHDIKQATYVVLYHEILCHMSRLSWHPYYVAIYVCCYLYNIVSYSAYCYMHYTHTYT